MMIQEAPSADAFVVVVVVTLTTLLYIFLALWIFFISKFFSGFFYFSLVPSYHHVKYSTHTHTHTRFRFTVLSVFEHFLPNNTHNAQYVFSQLFSEPKKKKCWKKKIIHIYEYCIKKLLSVCICIYKNIYN